MKPLKPVDSDSTQSKKEESSAAENEVRPLRRQPKGIYLLPNLFTTGSLFAAFYSIVAAMGQQYEAAAIAIFVAIMMDSLDGRVARLTNTQSAFGAEYDSLSDMVAFGLAPALVMYEWVLVSFGKFGWLVAFLYAAATALRLARFNTQLGDEDKRFFQGLASPAAAAMMASLLWFGVSHNLDLDVLSYYAIAITLFAGGMMVSNFRYRSFKDFDPRGRVPFVTMLMVVLGLVFISLDPPQILFAMSVIYALSGPIYTVWKVREHRQNRAKNH
ncbi:MAG TPA: CDP-diacylglycerol--serine O-phosphatidyltransferase [Gammaproteobacteria bacterium]|nr:CDP-diacylglycerol--serine O-phosphatidyltransferase [Gammaproteobacteria bacterium]